MKKIAIIGASYLQEPLISKAKEMGIETHVFAWATNDIGEKIADYFYPISIVDKYDILEKCVEIGIDGICSIASDLAAITVNYIAEKMNLVGNGMNSALMATNKHLMRETFYENKDPSPLSIMVENKDEFDSSLKYPVIVKPIDRSGSRGIYKLYDESELEEAIEKSKAQGFIKKVLIEEFVEGDEYSVECISFEGRHKFLALTKKYTTGAPHFIERGHLVPAEIEFELIEKIKEVIFHALDSLKVKYGASHSEIKIDDEGNIQIIEIGARMGGDFIGSTLVELSTGIDFTKAVIDVALGKPPHLEKSCNNVAGVRFVFSDEDINVYKIIKERNPEIIIKSDVPDKITGEVTDSSTRLGYYIMKAEKLEEIIQYMP